MRRFLISALAAAAVLAGTAVSAGATKLPPGWWHVEINVIIKHQPHTVIYDRGRVQSVGAASLTLRERDGTIVTVDVSATSRIKIAGRAATLAEIRPREIATTVRIDGGAATTVAVQIPPAVAAQLARAAARQEKVAARLARAQARGSAG